MFQSVRQGLYKEGRGRENEGRKREKDKSNNYHENERTSKQRISMKFFLKMSCKLYDIKQKGGTVSRAGPIFDANGDTDIRYNIQYIS